MSDPLDELFKEFENQIKWPDLYYLKEETTLAFYALTKLNENQENALLVMQNDLKARLSNDATYQSQETDEYKEQYAYHKYGGLEDLIFELTEQQRYSMCQSVFSFFEGRLRTLCEYVEAATQLKLKRKPSNKDDISHYHDFLAEEFKADLSQIQTLLMSIKSNKKVRNAIVHNAGWTTEGDLVYKAGQPQGLIISPRVNQFKLQITSPVYIEFIITEMQQYFALLYTTLGKRAQELSITG